MKEFKHVTKQELIDFLREYPFPLEHDFYMDWHSWNDFRDGRQWPESMIAMASIYDDEFKIYDGYIQEKVSAAEEGREMIDETFSFTAESTPEMLKFFEAMDEEDKANLFVPGNTFILVSGDRRIQYVALDPRQKSPKDGLFQEWISVEDDLPPPPDNCTEYLVRVRSGGPLYGGWEYDYDLAWWSEYWGRDGSHGYDWNSILTDWDGEVTITHWMPIPDPPEESE